MQDMEEAVEDLQRIDDIKTVEDLHHRKGMIHAYRRMLVYQETITRAYEEQEDAEAV